MKKILVSIFIILCMFFVGTVSYAISPDEQAKIFAEENLATYLKVIEPNYKDFNYNEQEQVMKSYLGEPIKNYIIDIEDFDTNSDILKQAKPYPFYVFPVMVDGNVITDFTILLENGEWQVVDIGGRLSRIIYNKSKEKGINPTENYILRYAGATYVIVSKDGKVTGYSPFLSEPSIGLEKENFTSSENLKKAFLLKKEILLELKNKNNNIDRGSINQTHNLDFHQNKSILQRVIKYINHVF